MPLRMFRRYCTGKDFNELMAYYNKNPHWTRRLEDYIIQLTWWTYSLNVDKKDRTLKHEDFVIEYVDSIRIQSDAEMERIAASYAAMYGAEINGDNSESSRQTDGQHATIPNAI